tara:strand:- start:1681 stop:1950 length:270 start_codon:yes stop_codon:yes gene_type:complete
VQVDQQLIIELKSNLPTITSDHTTQAKRYLRSAREKYPDTILMACVILFQKNGDVRFWRAKSLPEVSKIDVSVEHSNGVNGRDDELEAA